MGENSSNLVTLARSKGDLFKVCIVLKTNSSQGCQIFHGKIYPNRKNIPFNHTVYQMAIKIYQHLRLQDAPKFTQIGVLGLKICHLATLHQAADVKRSRSVFKTCDVLNSA
jgi:hypothetical protein